MPQTGSIDVLLIFESKLKQFYMSAAFALVSVTAFYTSPGVSEPGAVATGSRHNFARSD